MEEISLVLEQADSLGLVKDSDLFNSCDEDGPCPDIVPISPSSSTDALSADTPDVDLEPTPILGKNGKVKKRTWKKPKDKPKRPLSAYNIFFQHEREKIITDAPEQELSLDFIISVQKMASKRKEKRRHRKTHGKIGFADLARKIAEKWKKLDSESKSYFEARAEAEKARYKRELEVWNRKRHLAKELQDEADDASSKLDMDGGNKKDMPNEMNDLMPNQSLTSLMAQSHSFLQEQMMQSRHPNVGGPRSHPNNHHNITNNNNQMPSMVLSYSGGNNSAYINNFPYNAAPNHCGQPDYLDVAQQTFNMARSTLTYPSAAAGYPPMEQPGRRQFNGYAASAAHGVVHNNDLYFEPIGDEQDPMHDDGGNCLHFDPHAGMNSPGLYDAPLMPPPPKFHHYEQDHLQHQHQLHHQHQHHHLLPSGGGVHHRMDDFGNFMEHFERE
jgi:hypothetical protein